jgi:hypothetical protein
LLIDIYNISIYNYGNKILKFGNYVLKGKTVKSVTAPATVKVINLSATAKWEGENLDDPIVRRPAKFIELRFSGG